MASLCKKQQCTIDRRGFRQELDSWRHKLIHCVGFESILEGLIGPELVEDLKLFKDLKPVGVSDWSFDENCLFCCLRRDKVKEHLIGLNKEGLEDAPKHLIKDEITISRLEKQAEEFLSAVLNRKDVPSFSDPHIPVVAREILQRMISQFAAEYTSKTSSPQDSHSDSPPHSDQSLPTLPLLSGAPPPPTSPAASLAGPAHNQNPVLSKLLMADQDAPLDLTIKKPLAEPSEQDGVLDLSVKKNRYSSNLSVHSPCLSPAASTLKGESPDFRVTKAKDLQSTSTLEQFMAKLCPHHQRQIVDAIGFLQSEVKAHASSDTQKASNSTSGVQGTACAAASSSAVTPEKLRPELSSPSQFTPKTEVQEMSHSIASSCTIKKIPENVLSLKKSGAALDLCSPGSGSNQPPASPTANPGDGELNRHNDHAPLKMKILTSNGTGKKLSCVINTTLSSHADTLEDKQGNLHSSNKAETHSARLSSSVKRYSQMSLAHHARQRETLGNPKETSAKVFPVHITIPSDSARTARKTIRGSSEHRMRDSACRQMIDPDLGRCDIVFIDKPITECFKEQRRSVLPRRNARKSTRGHMYSDEIWELKTVRTLARRGNCPNQIPLISLITPKQILSMSEGVPPLDVPFAGACREKINQQMSTEESDESVTTGPGDVVEVAASKVDVVVETSQTDQCQNKEKSGPPSPVRCPAENQETFLHADLEQETTEESGVAKESGDDVGEHTMETLKDNEPESQEVIHNRREQTDAGAATEAEPLMSITPEEAVPQLPSDNEHLKEPVHQQNSSPTANQVEEDKGEKMQDEQFQKLDPETQISSDNVEVAEKVSTAGSVEELMVKEVDFIMPETNDSVDPLETENKDKSDLSSKSLDAHSKKLLPLRRKKVTKPSLPKSSGQTESVIVGYVNGKPVSASDRNLRHRAGSNPTSPSETPVKASQNTPEKTSADSTVDSNVENKKLDKTPLETHKPVVETSSVSQETELSSDTPSSPGNRFPSRTKQTQKQKSVMIDQESLPVLSDQPSGRSQSTEPKRQLRSTSQKTFGIPGFGPSNVLISISPPDPSTLILPALLPFTPPLTSSLLIRPSDPPVSEQSQQNTAPETVESDLENTQPVEVASKDLQKTDLQNNELDRESETKHKKLRPAKVLSENDKSEKHKLTGEVSNPENQIPVKTEMQTQPMPLRSKRVLLKESQASEVLIQKKDASSLEDRSLSRDDGSSSSSDRPTRMPLRSEKSRADPSHQSVTQSPVSSKKLALRSQRSVALSTGAVTETARQNDVASPVRIMPERITKAQLKPTSVSVTSVPHSSHFPAIAPKHEPPKQMPNKFFETLTGEESQHLITNLNIKFDKMQKGWVQMDKEGQPAAKYRNKSDRQAAIWKSKRRARKPKSSEQQKYSPVQMLFMKGFNLSSICRWFLETTETKSLVIVKKVNTRLPSETELCFHSSSNTSGTSQGVFPSLQAERLKKHLKKFAIASPVKSNPKSQKLIAKALEHEANAVKGKDKSELPSNTPTVTKSYSSAKASAQTGESQKSSGKSKNPASARILRKYSNIREKMQVQQTTARLKGASKMLKNKKINKKPLAATKSAAKSTLKPSIKGRKPAVTVSKQTKESAAKLQKRKMLGGKKTKKHYIQERPVRAQGSSRASRETPKKELPKRCSQRLGSPKITEHSPVDAPKNKVNNKKEKEADKGDMEKCTVTKMNSTIIQMKEPSQSTAAEVKGSENAAETPQQSIDVKAPASTDQVLTRSQRKMEAGASLAGSPTGASKRATKSTTQTASPKAVKKADEPTLTKSGVPKRHQTALLPRSATKAATKRAQELLETPAKRTRTK